MLTLLSSIVKPEEESDEPVEPTGPSQPTFEIAEPVVQVQLDGRDAGLKLESNFFEILNFDSNGEADELYLVTEWTIDRGEHAAPKGWDLKRAA